MLYAVLLVLSVFRKVHSHLTVTTIAGVGNSYVVENSTASRTVFGYSGGIWINSKNDVYISDQSNRMIRVISGRTKMVSTVVNCTKYPVNGYEPLGLWGDSLGDVYFSTYYKVFKYKRTINNITSVAGNYNSYPQDNVNATQSGLYNAVALSGDSVGNLFVADCYNQRIRKINLRSTIITTVAGTGSYGRYGDGGLAVNAALRYPQGVWVDSNGYSS